MWPNTFIYSQLPWYNDDLPAFVSIYYPRVLSKGWVWNLLGLPVSPYSYELNHYCTHHQKIKRQCRRILLQFLYACPENLTWPHTKSRDSSNPSNTIQYNLPRTGVTCIAEMTVYLELFNTMSCAVFIFCPRYTYIITKTRHYRHMMPIFLGEI